MHRLNQKHSKIRNTGLLYEFLLRQITVDTLNNKNSKAINIIKDKFNYIIKVGDFYFKKSAKLMQSRISDETTIKKINIEKLSSTKFRVFIGPYDNLNSL